MKKNANDFLIGISINNGKESQELLIPNSALRKWINTLKLEPNQETVKLEFTVEGKSYSKEFLVDTELAALKQAVKFAELATNIVPNFLQNYLVDITQEFSKKNLHKITGREHEIDKAWFYLSQKKRNNVFLVGDKDVGKTAIANEIARRIAVNDCPREFYCKRVLMLRPELLLKIKHNFWYEHITQQILNFLIANRNRVILFVDKAIQMKTDVSLIYILYACLKEYHIPLMVTSSENNFEDYFYEDKSIAKYINYIYIEEPELAELEPMIHPYIEKLQKYYNIKISDRMVTYAIFTSGLYDSVSANPGKIINILERAFLNAKRKDKKEVDKQCIISCYDARIKEYSRMPEEEKRATAYHEAGHYIVSVKSKYRKDVKISCVSSLPMNWWSGVTLSYNDTSAYAITSKEYFLDYIAMLLAGRIAEKKFTNLNSTGASSDLAYANKIAKSMIMEWGFSDKDLNINRQYTQTDYYLMPESKKELIDTEVSELISTGTYRASEIIEKNAKLLEIIAEKLLAEEILTGDELEAICNDYDKESDK